MSEKAPSAQDGTLLVVVYDTYQDPRFAPLRGAVRQVEDLADELSPFGYRLTVLTNTDQDLLATGLAQWSAGWRADGGHGPAVVAWSGHGEITPQGDLQLITHATQDLDDEDDYFTAERLANRALSARADQILILLDTCHAGAGAPAALKKALTSMARRTLPEPRRAWLGVLAACRAQERAEGARGLLLETVLHVLRHGPDRDGTRADGGYRHEWSVRNKGISGETLALAVMDDWPDSGQSPVRASVGRPEPIFRNPLWRPEAGEALVEHLVLAAKGIDPTEEGWFFTGRHRILREITDWLGTGKPGLLLLTGGPGSGKSAVAGRVAALSHTDERRALFDHAPLADDDPDPGEGSVDAALHLRGMRVQDVARALAQKLGLPAPETPAGLIAELEGLEADGARRHVLVLDGLDEAAPDQAGPIASQLLVPLARLCAVLLASRDRPFQPRVEPGETLDSALSRTIETTVLVVDLDAAENTAEDIAAYLHKRLLADHVPEGTVEDIASVLAERAVGSHGGFLFARIVASTLARQLAADPGRPWREHLPDGITDALSRDLASGAVLVRDGVELPHAASDLLTALAWSAGNGMPAHGVWETVAGAVGQEGTVYGPDDIDWVLAHYGRYIVEDSDGEQAVYRLYHRELVVHLQRLGAYDVPEGTPPAPWAVIHALAVLVMRQTQDGTRPEEANVYLRRHLADHALPAANVGIAVLRKLVEANHAAFAPVLASALNALSGLCRRAGLDLDTVDLAEEAVRIFRELAEAEPVTHLSELAGSLDNLAAQLGEAGRREEAVAPAEEAVRIHRELSRANPAAHLPGLAVSLNILASRRSEAGRRGALEPVQEATDLYRGLARDNPTAHLPSLAASLNNLARQLSEAGRWREALPVIEEATSLYRELTRVNPAAHLVNLTASLNNLAAQLAEAGKREEAVEPAEEAATRYRAFARNNPAEYQPRLAMALSNLANRLSDVGRRDEAMGPAQEALRIRRALADQNPAVYLPKLAISLNNLANHLAAVGQEEEALQSAEEAVRIRRKLAEDDPVVFLPDLATSLNNLGNRLAEVGRQDEALAPAQEAVRIRRKLAEDDPAVHAPGLATSLTNLAKRLEDFGRYAEALALAEEGLTLRVGLAQDNPAAHLPDFAESLDVVAQRRAAVGQYGHALEPAQQAAALYRELADRNPAAHLHDLAMALGNLANRLGESGRPDEAVTAAQEAVRIRRKLTGQNPAAYLHKLALALNNLANHLAAVGQEEEALQPAEEAVGIYRDLTRARPAAHLPDLAMALNNLGVHLAGVGRHEEAVAPADEAVRIRRELARRSPAAHLSGLADSLDNLARRLVETDRRDQAIQAYEETIGAFSNQPLAGGQLAYRYAVFLLRYEAADSAVHILCPFAARTTIGADGRLVVESRRLLRHAVRSHPELRTTVVRLCNSADEAPEWLDITDAALQLTASWLDTPTWEDSRAFLHGHPDLLTGETLPALREMASVDPEAELLMELLGRIAAGTPVDTAYRPLVLREALVQWIDSSAGGTDWAASAAHLAARATDLLASEASLELAAATSSTIDTERLLRSHRAILASAARRGVDAAYRLVLDLPAFRAGVTEAVSTADAETLGLLAEIEDTVHEAPWTSAVHRLAAQALSDGSTTPALADDLTGDLAAAAQRREPTAKEREHAVSEIAALIAARPDRASALSALLLAALATVPLGPGDEGDDTRPGRV
ncbi:tetratricopeptide repeat protein [Streptomyces sp. NPDC052127]|uniref:tetratricopeptide repeat protein n=1 Tax=Streptomyces sp. NPDC052127 TaxID=3155679 RepID=UPI003446A760